MSTRAQIYFGDNYDPKTALIYRHSDGYPESEHGVLADLQQFFSDVEEQTKDGIGGTRFNDPSYLAAKYVVWQANKNNQSERVLKQATPLDFIGIGIDNQIHGDIEYLYYVKCSEGIIGKTRPEVTYEVPEVSKEEEEKEDFLTSLKNMEPSEVLRLKRVVEAMKV